jgi:protein-disulfide isomerase
VSRRAILAATIVLALAGTGFYRSRAARLALAALPAAHPTVLSGPVAKIANVSSNNPAGAAEGLSRTASELAKEPTPALPVPQANSSVTDVDPHVAFGSKTAPIVMEIFSDFQCPACKTLFMTTNRQLMDNYVNTGKVYLIHRDFPLAMHAHSKVAAQYSRAAAQIGKFEPVEQALFQNQEKWEQSGDVDGTVAAVLSPAEMAKVRALVKNGSPQAAIEKDLALGRTYNVNQTPTTIFHSKGQTFPYAGNMSYEILGGFLDQLTSQK